MPSTMSESRLAPPLAAKPRPEDLDGLLDLCRNGGRDAQRRLYEKFHAAPCRLPVRRAGVDDADDVLQEVHLKAFHGLHPFNRRSPFAACSPLGCIDRRSTKRWARPSSAALRRPVLQRTTGRYAGGTRVEAPRRRAFAITETLERLIAAAASIGLSSIPVNG